MVELISPGRSSSSPDCALLFGGGDSERLSDLGRFFIEAEAMFDLEKFLSLSRSVGYGLEPLAGWEYVPLLEGYLSSEPAREPFADLMFG
jgi:hypothetical protein